MTATNAKEATGKFRTVKSRRSAKENNGNFLYRKIPGKTSTRSLLPPSQCLCGLCKFAPVRSFFSAWAPAKRFLLVKQILYLLFNREFYIISYFMVHKFIGVLFFFFFFAWPFWFLCHFIIPLILLPGGGLQWGMGERFTVLLNFWLTRLPPLISCILSLDLVFRSCIFRLFVCLFTLKSSLLYNKQR